MSFICVMRSSCGHTFALCLGQLSEFQAIMILPFISIPCLSFYLLGNSSNCFWGWYLSSEPTGFIMSAEEGSLNACKCLCYKIVPILLSSQIMPFFLRAELAFRSDNTSLYCLIILPDNQAAETMKRKTPLEHYLLTAWCGATNVVHKNLEHSFYEAVPWFYNFIVCYLLCQAQLLAVTWKTETSFVHVLTDQSDKHVPI